MSSFTIDKREYVKAAGLMYGIEESKGREAHKYFMRNVRQRFEECYRLNAESVAEQYDEEPERDENAYDEEFERFREAGRKVWSMASPATMSRRMLTDCLMKFFQSVRYQIENEDMETHVAAFFFDCISHLCRLDHIEGWWGEVEDKFN